MEAVTARLIAVSLAVPDTRAPGRGGRIAAGTYDQDAVTLAVDAAAPLLEAEGITPSALVLASVSNPFAEGGSAQVVAEALGIHGELLVQEHCGSIAAGGAALVAATTLAEVGRGPVLWIATDARRDEDGRALGDAACAALLTRDDGASSGVARIVHLFSTAEVVRERWRLDGATTVTDADRSLRGFRPTSSFRERLASHGEAPPIVAEADRPALDRVGVLGTAAPLVHGLLALPETAAATTTPVGVSAGGVSHGFTLSPGPAATAAIAELTSVIEGGHDADWPSTPVVAGFDPYASQPRSWRERGQDLRLEGQRDQETGEVLFPPVPAPSAPQHDPYRLARIGTVLTFTRDHVFPYGGPLTMAVVELDGGGRFFGQVADVAEVAIGDRVMLVLRRLHDGGGLPHYFWKIRPTATPTVAD